MSKVAPKENSTSGTAVTVVSEITGVAHINRSLSKWQVKLRANKRFQGIVAAVTIFAVFCDVLGTAVILPGLASVCAYADGGPAEQIVNNPHLTPAAKIDMLDKYVSPHAFKDPKPPTKFSMSMNLVMSLGFVGSAAGSSVFGRLADRVGCKIPIQICLFCGCGGYIIIYASAIWAKSYWLFMLGNVWNNFFGCSMDIGMVYFGQMFSGAERDNYQGMVMGMGLIGGTVGSFIVMPFSNTPSNGANYFEAMWLALGFTVLALVLVSVVLVTPAEDAKKTDEKVKAPPLPSDWSKKKMILCITIAASALDSGGDEGTRMVSERSGADV